MKKIWIYMDENLKSNFHTGYIQVHQPLKKFIFWANIYLLYSIATLFLKTIYVYGRIHLPLNDKCVIKNFFSFEFNETWWGLVM